MKEKMTLFQAALLVAAVQFCRTQGARDGEKMEAFVAEGASSSTWHYDDSFPVPYLGKLHEVGSISFTHQATHSCSID